MKLIKNLRLFWITIFTFLLLMVTSVILMNLGNNGGHIIAVIIPEIVGFVAWFVWVIDLVQYRRLGITLEEYFKTPDK